MDLASLLAERMARVEQRVSAACQRAGRHRSEVAVLAVTKTLSLETTAQLPSLGMSVLAENRPQDLWKKAAAIPGAAWHLIGHLQRNKIERTLPLVQCIHSVDSVRLLEALDAEAAKQNLSVPILLEVNASGEASKHGFTPKEVPDLVPTLEKIRHLQIRGLMTMAAYHADAEECRPTFTLLRKLRDKLRKKWPDFQELSMGMTNDFEVAIEEGATMVRLGTVYFEGIK